MSTEQEAKDRASKLLASSIEFRSTITDIIKREVIESLTGGANLNHGVKQEKEAGLKTVRYSPSSISKLMSSDEW
jgi:hypothetical protein